jgi:hypothetical protein
MGILFFLKGNRSVATGTTIYFLSYIIYYVFFVKKHLLIILFPIPTGRCASKTPSFCVKAWGTHLEL